MKIKLLYAAILLAALAGGVVAANYELGLGYLGTEEPKIACCPEDPQCPPFCRTSHK